MLPALAGLLRKPARTTAWMLLKRNRMRSLPSGVGRRGG